MNVELLYFEGCPNSRIVHDRLTVLEAELGIHLSRREVSTPEDAERLRLYRAAHVAGRGVDSAGGVGAEVAGATTGPRSRGLLPRPYRAFAPEAVRTLREHGYAARYLADGLPGWADAGRDVEVMANSGATVNR